MTVRDLTILGCSSQQPTRMRNHGAYLVRWNEEGLSLRSRRGDPAAVHFRQHRAPPA